MMMTKEKPGENSAAANDNLSLNSFIHKNGGKEVVVVQGLGFVGAVMSLVVAAENRYAVIGVDLPERKEVIDELNNGDFPIQCTDQKVYEYFDKVKEQGNFLATSDCHSYALADVIIVDINLDVAKQAGADKTLNSYNVDLSGFRQAIKSIAERCKEDVLLIVETTVPPGTCQKVVRPIFEVEYQKRGLPFTFKIGHSYERVMPGPGYVDSITNFYRVYSGIDKASANDTEKFLKTIISTDQFPLTRLGGTNASEMSKVLENSFRAMNIAFIQEWTEYAEAADVNLFEVIDAIRIRPTHKNIMRPGLGVGGYCLTKDPLLASWSSQNLFEGNALYQSEKAVKINDQMPLHTFEVVSGVFQKKDLSSISFLILGISYLPNVGDTRYSPVELLYDKLQEKGADIELHDPFTDQWREKNLFLSSWEEINGKSYDAIIIGTPHDYYLEGHLSNLLTNSEPLVVFDPHGSLSERLMIENNQHKYKIIGRGDV